MGQWAPSPWTWGGMARCFPLELMILSRTSPWRSSKGFLILLWKYVYMAFGGIWQHGKCSYGVWQWFAYNSENFEKWSKTDKCKQFSPATGFGPKPYKRFLLPAKAPPRQTNTYWKPNFCDHHHLLLVKAPDCQYRRLVISWWGPWRFLNAYIGFPRCI